MISTALIHVSMRLPVPKPQLACSFELLSSGPSASIYPLIEWLGCPQANGPCVRVKPAMIPWCWHPHPSGPSVCHGKTLRLESFKRYPDQRVKNEPFGHRLNFSTRFLSPNHLKLEKARPLYLVRWNPFSQDRERFNPRLSKVFEYEHLKLPIQLLDRWSMYPKHCFGMAFMVLEEDRSWLSQSEKKKRMASDCPMNSYVLAFLGL
jgi:hypothetical protein